VTVLAIFGFLFELFPGRPLLVGGVTLICAYQPVFTWISSGVNPDALLIALGAVMFWLFARASQRGLDERLAVGLGLVFAAAVITKVSAIGFAPGWAAGMLLLLWRRRPQRPWHTAVKGALAASVPLVLYALVNVVVWDRSLLPGGVSAAAHDPSSPQAKATSGFATLLWQYVLPKTGGMTDFLRVGWAPRDFWTPMWVGKFGWYDYQFPDRVNHLMFVVYCVIAVAALAALVPQRRRLGLPMLIYVLLAAGLVVAIARAAYPLRVGGNFIFEQARYLMPLLGLYALALALAASPLRRRLEVAALGVFLGGSVLLLLAAWEMTIKRYYL
jgi:4-amino-4-deoxy-L-arabinose transferase-like glycosyltransferase